jgi:hypothetical protein
MKKYSRDEENCKRQTAKQHWNSSSSYVSDRTRKYVPCNQVGSVVIVQKVWRSKCKVVRFLYCWNIGIESSIIGFYKLPDHNKKKWSFFGLIKSSLCKGADRGKGKIKIKS